MESIEHGARGQSRGPLSSRKQDLTRRRLWPTGGVPVALCVVLLHALGCESKVTIATYTCPQASNANLLGNGGSSSSSGTFDDAWSSGFETAFCDFTDGRGSWIMTGSGRMGIVTEPVRTGDYAAAFTVDTDEDDSQARVIRQGSFPVAAYYGAYYYVPRLATSTGNWNLFFFQGGKAPTESEPNPILHGLWDVSIVDSGGGALRLNVLEHEGLAPRAAFDMSNAPPIPIETWFHVELYLHRAADATGEITLYQDNTVILQLDNIVTDDSTWGQWLLGNLADALDPPQSTLYVDDVTIRTTR